MVKAQMDGRSRYTIKPIEEQLSFDKVGRPVASSLLTEGWPAIRFCQAPHH